MRRKKAGKCNRCRPNFLRLKSRNYGLSKAFEVAKKVACEHLFQKLLLLDAIKKNLPRDFPLS